MLTAAHSLTESNLWKRMPKNEEQQQKKLVIFNGRWRKNYAEMEISEKERKKGSCEPTYKHTKQNKTVRNDRLTDSDADQDVSPLSEDDVHV